MKKFGKSAFLYLFFILVIVMIPTAFASAEVQISSENELRALAEQVNNGNDYEGQVIVLTTDIVLNRNVVDGEGNLNQGTFSAWVPIGTSEHPFKGSFDGQGHTITGLYIEDESSQNQGLFGCTSGATISNLTVKDGYLKASNQAAAVVGYADNGTIIASCHNDNTSAITANRSGGVVGSINKSHLYNCSSSGYMYSNRCSGGIVGDVYRGSKIYNCYSAATVDGRELVGGISGGTTDADLQNCLFVGDVLFGGGYLLAGGAGSRSITNCFALQNDSHNTGRSLGGGIRSAQSFADTRAVLDTPVTVNEQEYSTVLSALNAWVSLQNDEMDYSPWVQNSLYPYLRDGVTSAIKTSYGSEVSEWSSHEMEEAYKRGLIPDSLIGEDLTKAINRAEFAAVCVKVYENLAGTSALPAVLNPFNDTQDVEILKAYNLGIVKGISDTEFAPSALLEREQAAAMLTRCFKRVTMPGWTLTDDSEFKLTYTMPAAFNDDGQISDYAKDSVYFMAANGIISGFDDGNFRPKNTTDRETAESYANATREQALAIALRMVQNLH